MTRVTVFLGVLALLLASCRYRFDAVTGDASTDRITADAKAIRWGPPRRLTELDQGGNETDPTVTADLLTIVWARTVATDGDDLWTATRTTPSAPFTNLTALTNLSSPVRDYSPELSPDGNTLYFSSERNGQTAFYVSRRSGSVWSDPVLATELSSNGYEGDLGLSPDFLITVFRRSAGFFRADRTDPTQPFGVAALVPELGPPVVEFAAPTLGDNAGVVYFHGGVPRDLYVARWNGAAYDLPAPVVELNTDARNADPFISGDESYMIFNCGAGICETRPE